jgi:ParB family chromosome partitioning protein
MNIQEYPIAKIIPDPSQPRTVFPPTRIAEMAKSILTEGVINPVEIDKDGVIVTGEMRWRAAKEAGLKTIRVSEKTIQGHLEYLRERMVEQDKVEQD